MRAAATRPATFWKSRSPSWSTGLAASRSRPDSPRFTRCCPSSNPGTASWSARTFTAARIRCSTSTSPSAGWSSTASTADYEALDAAISGRDRGGRAASAVYFETLTNPLLQISNVNRISAIAHRYGALSIVDNTFVTPYLQQPLDLGADIVIHSATKYLAGHSEVNAGLVVVLDDEVGNGIYFAQNRFGGVLAPTECNDVRRGIQTLALRMECQQRNAQAVAEYLLAHPLVRAVHYPGVYGDRNRLLAENGLKGFGGVLSFEVVPGVDPSIVLDNLHVFHLAVSLGAVESLAELPCRMTHFELPREERLKVGITDELVRLSVGIEDVSDLIEDLGQGFDKAFEALDIDGVSGQVLDRLTTEVAA